VNLLTSARHRTPRALLAVALAAGIAIGLARLTPALAHHAFAAEYDSAKPLDLSGTVTRARWANPHSWLYFDVKQADGTTTNWGVELGAPNTLALKGLAKADLKPGAQVHITGYRSKNGGEFGYAVTLQLGDGRSFQTGGAQDAPPTGAPASNQ
jgi:hypothetical protein